MKRALASLLLGGFLGLGVIATASAADRPDGEYLYRRYCASCHGVGGEGNGPDAFLFAAPPRSLREGFLQRYDTEALVQRVREGKPLDLALDPKALRAHVKDTEAIDAHLHHLASTSWARVDRGQEIYIKRCEGCHGMFGRGRLELPRGVTAPRDLAAPAFQRSVGDETLVTLVRHGRKGMPALTPRITPDEANALVAYVRLFSPGFEMYARYCASCHGEDGRGAGSLAETLRLPTVIFDRAYFAKHDAEQVRADIWHMVREHKPMMPHYRTKLDEPQAGAIIEYLKASPSRVESRQPEAAD